MILINILILKSNENFFLLFPLYEQISIRELIIRLSISLQSISHQDCNYFNDFPPQSMLVCNVVVLTFVEEF